MKAPLSASQSVNQNHLFSKLADRSSMNFHTNFWFLKDKKVMHPGKNPKKKNLAKFKIF